MPRWSCTIAQLREKYALNSLLWLRRLVDNIQLRILICQLRGILLVVQILLDLSKLTVRDMVQLERALASSLLAERCIAEYTSATMRLLVNEVHQSRDTVYSLVLSAYFEPITTSFLPVSMLR